MQLFYKLFFTTLLFFTASLIASSQAIAEKWLQIGPEGGSVVALVSHPNKAEKLFASVAASGLYVSNNAGATWEKVPPFSNRAYYGALAISPSNENTIYAGAGGGNEMFRSVDGGNNWQEISSGLPTGNLIGNINQIVVNPANTQIIAVITASGIYQSTNGGNSWQEIITSDFNSSIKELTFLSGNIVIAIEDDSTNNEGIYKRSAATNNWINIAPNNTQGFRSVTSSLDGNNLIALGIEGVWVSDDQGLNWSLKNNGLLTCTVIGVECSPEEKGVVFSKIILDATDSQTIYAYAGAPFIARSVNLGDSWQYIDTEHLVQTLTSLPNGQLYLGDFGDGVFYSQDSGDSWQNRSSGINVNYVAALKVDPIVDNKLIMSSYYQGMLKTTDNGNNWDDINQGLIREGFPEAYNKTLESSIRAENIWVDQNNPQLMLVKTSAISAYNGLFRSANGGTSWTKITNGLPPTIAATKILRSSIINSPIYLASARNGIYVSNDEGLSWQKNAVASVNKIVDMTITSDGVLYVITKETGSDSRLLKSDDHGVTFQLLSFAPPEKMDDVFASDSVAGAAIFATTVVTLNANLDIAEPGKLYRSTNNGQTWQRMSFTYEHGPVSTIEFSPANPNTIYLGTNLNLTTDGQHLFKSTNNGTDFTPLGSSIEPLDVRHIIVNPHQPNEVYVATYTGGLYKSNVLPNINIVAPTQTSTGQTVTLDGSASSDREGNIASYQWAQVSGINVTLNNSSAAIAEFITPNESANLKFKLTVTDLQGESAEQTFDISVNSNQLPVVLINTPAAVNSGDNIILDGSNSSDSDGNIVSYLWTQTSGETVNLTNSTTASATFTAPNVAGDLVFTLTIVDNDGGQKVGSVSINVSANPTPNVPTNVDSSGGGGALPSMLLFLMVMLTVRSNLRKSTS